MKKSVLLLVLLLAVSVSAQENLVSSKSIPRYTNMELDNIHILRLQDASMALSKNVSDMHAELQSFHAEQSQILSDLRSGMEQLKSSMSDRISGMQTVVDGLPDQVAESMPQLQSPVEIQLPPYVMVLLGVNILLLAIVIILIFWLREQYYVHKVVHKEEHIHPAPPELIAFVSERLDRGKKLGDIRMELANKGWTPSIIEHAIHAAKEK